MCEINPRWISASTAYAFQTRRNCGSDPVRKCHSCTIPCSSEYDSTSSSEVAAGFASIPSSCTREPAAPSIALASNIAAVVSGHSVVHSESSNASSTTLPRNDRKDTGSPNWSLSVKLGAGRSNAVPGSNSGLLANASLCAVLDPPSKLSARIGAPIAKARISAKPGADRPRAVSQARQRPPNPRRITSAIAPSAATARVTTATS